MGVSRGVTAAARVLIEGREVALPVVVRDATVVTASFVVAAAGVRRLVDPRLEVAAVFGRTLCIVTAVEYRDNDLGRYDEVGVAFLVRCPRVSRRVGAYIHRLPVTTAFSCAAGREVWGFPKIVADIRRHDGNGRRTTTLAVDGTHVLTLTVRVAGRRRVPERPLDAFAVRDGVLWRTPFTSRAEGLGVRLGGASLALGPHPIAAELAALGLGRRALASTSIARMQARFEAPERLD
ncbi:MAG TPA: acetoacetate decarboxylase family protein [Candidatus Binatia bacterium]|nr:acetoacetate decarboxylase family protein [Candidatus Binatia bacterium]